MLGLTIAALLLALPSNVAAQGNERAARCEARDDVAVVEWKTERKALEEDAVRIELSESYKEQMEAYRKQVAAYREGMAALDIRAGDEPASAGFPDDCPECDIPRFPTSSRFPDDRRVPDELPVVSVHMERNTKTSERHGFLGLQWDQREIADVDLFQIDPNLYFVVGVSGSSSLKAPLGDWHVEHEDVPDFYPPCLYPGRALIRGNVRDDFE